LVVLTQGVRAGGVYETQFRLRRPDARFQRHLNVPARGDEDVHVRCHEPGALPFEQQVALSRKTSTTVSFHGTVSYLVLFQRDGTSAVIVGRPPLKETDVTVMCPGHVSPDAWQCQARTHAARLRPGAALFTQICCQV
jgi:hypothetical protein